MLTLDTLLIALAGLFMRRRFFASHGMHGDATTGSYANLTLIVILAPAVMDRPTGSTAGIPFFDGLLMFARATVYGVVAVYVFDAFRADTTHDRRTRLTPG